MKRIILIPLLALSFNAHAGLFSMAVGAGMSETKKCDDVEYFKAHKFCQYEELAKDKLKEHLKKKLEQQNNQ